MCYQTEGPNITACNIDTAVDQWCSIQCELKVDKLWHCVRQCHDNGVLCQNNVTARNIFHYCCKESYCNSFFDNVPSPSSSSTTQTTLNPSGK